MRLCAVVLCALLSTFMLPPASVRAELPGPVRLGQIGLSIYAVTAAVVQ